MPDQPLTPRPPTTTRQWRYQSLLILLAPVLIIYTAWQALRQKDLRYFKQRMGFGLSSSQRNPIWLHAASVGEVIAAQPLINRLITSYAPSPVLITTATPTGGAIVKQRFGDNVMHCYLPLDWRFAVNRFLNTLTPRCALIMETEIWPNLYHQCDKKQIPLITVNGRLSNRTLKTKDWVKQLYRQTLQHSSAILCRSEQDTQAFITLGADAEKTKTIGNLKFSANIQARDTDTHPLNNQAFIVAASTHNNEEELLANLWHNNLFKDYLLVIAPRHPQRLSTIKKQLNRITSHLAIRSEGDVINQQTRLYLADTLGELTTFMKFADIVIMGGSFIPHGGHNILEPALLAKAIVFGPYMHNFDDEARRFLNHDAAIQCHRIDELESALLDLINNPAKRQALGERAKALVESNRNIADDYLREILNLVPT